jgi:hypothetical protein
MWAEFIGYFWCLAVLWLVGLGPALFCIRAGARRLAYAFAAAPALGFAIFSLISFPLVRYLAPVHVWAWPAAAATMAASLALIVVDWRRRRAEYAALASRWTLPAIGLVVLCNFVLAIPLVLRGIQYAIYRSNPSDAFLYMSLAETLRVANWPTLLRGSALTLENWPGITALAHISPTALFAARQVALPLALNNMTMLAWFAELAGSSVTQFYYVHHLLAYGAALPLVLALSDHLRLPRWLTFMSAPTIVLGFWARFVLETDSGYEISVLPIMLLMTLAWINLEGETPRLLSGARVLLAITWATVIALYAPLGLVIAVAFGLYYGIGLLEHVVTLSSILLHGVTIALALLILAATGQLDFLARAVVSLVARAPNEARFGAPVLELFKANGVAALWGLAGKVLWASRGQMVRVPLDLLAGAVGLLLTVILVLGAVRASRPVAAAPTRIVFAMLSAGLLLGGLLLAVNNGRAAGKSVTYIYPLLILGLLSASVGLDWLFKSGARKMVLGVVTAWLASQAAMGLFLPLRGRADFLGQPPKTQQYDLSAITRQLDTLHPALLLVDIPRGNDWMFAYYSMFVFGRYPAQFQSGLIIDNNVQYQSLWLDSLRAVPDYAVVLKEADYIGPEQLGLKVAETRDLVLYRITSGNLMPFLEKEAEYRLEEATKPPFPSLAD